MDKPPVSVGLTASEATIMLAVVLIAAASVAAVLLRERAPTPRVRVVSMANDVAGCNLVTELSVQIGNPNGNKFDQARSQAADIADADRTLRSRAATAGADTVLVTSPGLIVRAKAYRCGSPR